MNNRIMRVSQIVQDYLIHSTLDFRYSESTFDRDTLSLMEAQKILNPAIEELEELVSRQCQDDHVDEDAVNDLRFAQMHTSYITGLIAGLHLAGRPDRIPELAKAYGDEEGEFKPHSLWKGDKHDG